MKVSNKIAIYVFIDAFGWEVYQQYGFLNDLLPYSRRLETTFGFSSAADPSILTGRYPNEHSHWSSFIYDPQNSPFKALKVFSFLPPVLFDRWRVRHNLSKIIKRIYGFTGYFELYSVPFKYLPYFDYLEKRDYFVPGGILKTDTIFDWCVKHQVPYYCSNWRDSESRIIQANKQQISEGNIKFAYVYLPKLDAVMHEFGPASIQTKEKLNSLETEIKNIYQLALRKYTSVSLYVISDHGMAPVKKSIDLMFKINSLSLKYGKDYIGFYDSTMARFWFLNSEAYQAIVQVLESIPEGTIISKDEIDAMHVLFEHNKFGDLYFLLNEGILINPSFMGKSVIAGMHGYHPKALHSYSLMLSNREIPSDVNSITDIRKTMENEIAGT